ncbi:hypothetical protein X798_03219 [Onchocerca flexuosa]|uniref:CNNM transmembrane domain-containing protein n=1 Tax=Onchocerca flexuosa TaxID=387005 RepID=A0A238BY24_9BILA|nr:hypothetical protein X798_03219 [Onchocerca flexuosa]
MLSVSLQISVNLLASRSPHWISFPLHSLIVIILLMLTISVLFSGLNLSFKSVAINELNIITHLGDAYKNRLAKNIIPVCKHLNWLICTFAIVNVIINCELSFLLENILQYKKITMPLLSKVLISAGNLGLL